MGEGSPLDEGGTDLELLGEDYSALILVEANLEVPPTFQLRRTDPNRRVAEFFNTLAKVLLALPVNGEKSVSVRLARNSSSGGRATTRDAPRRSNVSSERLNRTLALGSASV